MQARIKIKRKEILPLIYCVFTSIYYTFKGWQFSSNILEGLLIVAVMCGLVTAFQSVLNKWKSLIVVIPLAILVIYRMSLGADTRLFVSLIAVLVGMNISFDRIAKWILNSKCVTFLVVFFVGGYTHLNYIAVNIGVIMFLVVYIYYPRNKMKSLIITSICYLFGVFVSRSGAMIICSGVGLVLYMFMNTKLVKKILSSKILFFLFPIVLFINWLLAVLYAAYGYSNPDFYFIKKFVPNFLSPKVLPILQMLNVVVSGRINLAAFSIGKFGFSLWGGNIDYSLDTGLPYFLVDSGMILLLQDWGIVMAIVVMSLLVFLMIKLIKEKEYRLIVSAIVIALWAVNEDILLSVGTNYLFYIIGRKLYTSRNQISETI